VLHTDHGRQMVNEITPGNEAFQDFTIEDRITNEPKPRIAYVVLHLEIGGHVKDRNFIALS